MTAFRKASESFFLAGQLAEADFAAATEAGIAMIINNRPDGEAPDQPPADQAREAAARAGLDYEHIPVNMAAFGPDLADAMDAALSRAGGPVLAYCASGMRSALLWALVRARRGEAADDILADTEGAGYDLERFRGLLDAVRPR